MPLYLPSSGGGGGSDLPFADLDQAEVGQTVLYDGAVYRPGDLPEGVVPPAAGYAADVLAHAPLAYWRLGDASGLMVDASGNGHDGVYDGTAPIAGLVVGDDDGAQTFDGDAVAVVDDASWLDHQAACTLLATIKPDQVAAGTQTLIARFDGWAGGTFAPSSFALRAEADGKMSLHTFNGNGENNVTSEADVITAGGTHDVAATIEAGNLKVYVDGAVVASGVVAGVNDSSLPLTIGANAHNHGEAFTGVIDEVVYLDEVLTGVQVMALHLSRSGG